MVWLSPQSWSCSRSRPLSFCHILPRVSRHAAPILVPFPVQLPAGSLGWVLTLYPALASFCIWEWTQGLCVSTDAAVILWAFQVSLPAGLGASCKPG